MKMVHVTIKTKEFEKEIDFYKNFVEMNIVGDMRDKGLDLVFLADEERDTKIEIIRDVEAKPIDNENISVGFHTDNLEAMHEKLVRHGFDPTPFISPVPGVSFFIVKDPAGLRVQFI